MSAIEIHGEVAPGFERVRDVFIDNFTERDELGASVCAYVKGVKVVDLWAGVADVESGRPWSEDTMAVMFSATKGMVALAFLMLEDRGLLDVDKPVAWYWPGFGRKGKKDITVRMLLNHRAGISVVDTPLNISDFADQRYVEAALEAQVPTHTPGTVQAYGATAWGMYTQALFRRIAGETVGTFLRREVFEPLDADMWVGLPRHLNERVATVYPVTPGEIVRVVLPKVARQQCLEGRFFRRLISEPDSLTRRGLLNPSMGRDRLKCLNRPEIRAMELPWMNGIGTARALAKVYAALSSNGKLGKVRLVSAKAIRRIDKRQSWAYSDGTLVKPMGYSQGFIKEEPHLISPNEAAFGHTGAGGTVGFGDPTHKLGMSYVMNRMDHHIRSPRCVELCHAMYGCLQDV